MGIAIGPLRVFQGGPETTHGTPVAATRKFSLENLAWTSDDEVYRPRIVNGILIDNPGGDMIIRRGSSWTATGPVIYNELHRWASMCVAPHVVSGVGPYTHTFTRGVTSAATLKSWTMERRLSDGTNHIDNEWTYALAQSLRLTGELDSPVMMEVNGTARRILSSTLTAALTQVTFESPPAVLTKVYIDPAWASLGSTQITGQVLRWDVTFRSGVQHVNTMDGRTDLDFATHAINGDNSGIDINLRMMLKADSGQYATEKTAAEAQSLRAVRIEVDALSGTHTIEIDALTKHVAGSIRTVDEQDGFLVFDMALISSTDLSNAYLLKVINAEATL